MRVSWITTEDDQLFLRELIKHTSTDISLFKQQNIQQIVKYLWEIVRPYFI